MRQSVFVAAYNCVMDAPVTDKTTEVSKKKKYFSFSRREIPVHLRDDWYQQRLMHNRRFLRISAVLSIIATILMFLRRLFYIDPSYSEKLNRLFNIEFVGLLGISIIYLIGSLIYGKKGPRRWHEIVQHLYIALFLSFFAFLSYLDMQVAPDFSALIGVIVFLSVAFWLDTLSYVLYLIFIAALTVLNFQIGVHISVVVSELYMEVAIFSIVGFGMFFATNEMRTRNFINGHQLEQSILEMRDLSLRDPLTRLFNRRMLNEELDRETAFSRRTSQPVTLILLDIDHFKRVNDSLGHSVGDEVLSQSAERLIEVVRETDRVYRFGGEEFIIMLPNSSLPSARALAERLLRGFSEKLFDGVPWPITISMGIADNTERMLPADLIKLADSRMYAAKTAGRNRFVWEGCSESSSGDPVIP